MSGCSLRMRISLVLLTFNTDLDNLPYTRTFFSNNISTGCRYKSGQFQDVLQPFHHSTIKVRHWAMSSVQLVDWSYYLTSVIFPSDIYKSCWYRRQQNKFMQQNSTCVKIALCWKWHRKYNIGCSILSHKIHHGNFVSYAPKMLTYMVKHSYQEFMALLKWWPWHGSYKKGINRGVRSYILNLRWYVIKYQGFDDRHPTQYADDGVHRSFIGNDIFLN